MATSIGDSGLMRQISRFVAPGDSRDAYVPAAPVVVNRRPEPFFDKYIITGRTYTTASGEVIPNELLYFDGQMAHLYGECSNVAAVNQALEGSGYKSLTLQYPEGKQTAAAQLWASRFTDTTIGPY